MDLLHSGSKACDGGGDFLKMTSSDVLIEMTAAGRKAQGEKQGVGTATDQLQVGRCSYLRLDLPEVIGLVLELTLNSYVLLKIEQK